MPDRAAVFWIERRSHLRGRSLECIEQSGGAVAVDVVRAEVDHARPRRQDRHRAVGRAPTQVGWDPSKFKNWHSPGGEPRMVVLRALFRHPPSEIGVPVREGAGNDNPTTASGIEGVLDPKLSAAVRLETSPVASALGGPDP